MSGGVTPTPPVERILRRSVREDRGHETLCHVFKGCLRKGYGQITIGSRTDGSARRASTHRQIWEHHNGPIPGDQELDHLCKQRDCHEITHLELVTHHENLMRGDTVSARHAAKTHCIHGHEFTPENTYVHHKRNGRKSRHCRQCMRDYRRMHPPRNRKRVYVPFTPLRAQKQREYRARKRAEQLNRESNQSPTD